MPFADVRRRHVRLFWVTVTEVCSRLHLDEHAPRRAKGLDESFEQEFVSCRVLRTRVDHCGIAEFFVRLAVWRLLARLHRLAGNIEREAEAALNCNAHRPRLHLHIIPHGDRIQEGASPLLADCDEPNRLAPALVVLAPASLVAAAPPGCLADEGFGEGEPVAMVYADGVPPLRLL